MSTPQPPSRAGVVVVGGGVIGLSTAYHLARAGVPEVVLLERGQLGSGSTCKAAGGVRAQFSDAVNVELGLRSLRAFETFEQTFGQDIGLRQVGYLFLLDRPEQVAAFEAGVALQNHLGVPSRLLDPAEARRLSPLISTEGLLGAAWSPTDGHCTPEAVVAGYAAAAGRAGAMVGVDLPVEPLRRQVLTTGPVPGLDPATPFTIDFSTSLYFHREGPGLLLGMSDPDETPGFKLSRSDAWLPRLAEAVAHRAPALADVGIAPGWAGLYEVTPDHNALVGEAPGVSRFLYATGFSGHGFLMGPAVGEVVRDLYLGVPPAVDVTGLDARRFGGRMARPELNIV